MAMEFWGVEVKAGQPLKVELEEGRIIHVSQAALGEVKKGKGSDLIPLFLEINGKKFVVGSLSSDNIPQATFDLVFEKDFVLSHGAKSGSVYFCGYSTDNPFLGDKDEDDFSDSEDVPEDVTANGKIEAKPEEVKPAATKGKSAKPESSTKQKIAVPAPKKEESEDSDDDSDDSEEGSSDDDEDMLDASDDQSGSEDDSDDDSEDDSEEEEEETPKKVEVSKKRSNDSAAKTPVPSKKAKIVTPQKTDGKKGAHTATPHPSKKTVAKTPATTSNTKDKSPKSDGKITCGSCSKTFNSDNALQAHSKAKHSAK